jgi:hypothetical protein
VKLNRETGDLGVTAQRVARTPPGESPSVVEVHQRLSEIAAAAGAGSLQKKLDGFTSLLRDLDPVSAKHLVRITLGKMRVGIGYPTVLDALSFAKKGDRSLRPILEAAFNRTSDLGLVARTRLTLSQIDARIPVAHLLRRSVPTPWAAKGGVMRTVMEAAGDHEIDTTDGVRVTERDRGWVLVLPDPADAVTHLWAEGNDADTAQLLLDEWAAVVERAGH